MIESDKIQLFLLHFAGGNSYSFQFLKPYCPDELEFRPLELPGRGKRMNQELLFEEEKAIADLVKQINSLRNESPYLIYGHSMGASLGLRVTQRMEELGDSPERLIVSGNAGPGVGEKIYRSEMNDGELKEELRSLGGIPEEVLENDELFNFFAPVMRADFQILENGRELNSDFKIRTAITAIMGDLEDTAEHIDNWKKFTLNTFQSKILNGNHFFIHDHPSKLIDIIKNCYGRYLVHGYK